MFNAETGTWECGRLAYCLEDAEGAQEPLPTLAEGGTQGSCGRKGVTLGHAGPGTVSQEGWAMEQNTCEREDWFLGQFLKMLPLHFTPTHRRLTETSAGSCDEIPLHAEEAAAA